MTIKTFYFSQLADLRIEGVGIHASYSVNLVVKEENRLNGKDVYISATGKSNTAKAAGSGNILFWCKVKDLLNNKTYILQKVKGENFVVGFNDIIIGSTRFHIPNKGSISPKLEVEAGYLYDAGYTGAVPPLPGSLKRIILLTLFSWE